MRRMDLQALLRSIDGRQYPCYRDLEGTTFAFDDAGCPFTLVVEHAQGDAFAPPTRCSAVVPLESAGFPEDLHSNKIRAVALCDFINRTFCRAAQACGADLRKDTGGWSGVKGGDLQMQVPSQHVLERSSVSLTAEGFQLLFTVGLPARGRTICGDMAWEALGVSLPALIARSVKYSNLDPRQVQAHVDSVEDQEHLRAAVVAGGLVAFVRSGAVLPRDSGDSDLPLRPRGDVPVVPFAAPPTLECAFDLPHAGVVKGMGVRPGVSLIVGGGFHGKSTLLSALAVGCYNHVPGDGREFVVCHPDLVSIRAEDGRSVSEVDISAFVRDIPFGKDTRAFSTRNASGSTSQASAIMEALEIGARVLLFDEDVCATNAMIRDSKMQALVHADKEPLIPLLAHMRGLVEEQGVSCILAIGAMGDYFEVADTVIHMDAYVPVDVTARAKAIASASGAGPSACAPPAGVRLPAPGSLQRHLVPSSFAVQAKCTARSVHKISLGEAELDLACLRELVEVGQTRAILEAVTVLLPSLAPKALRHFVEALDAAMDRDGVLRGVSPKGWKSGVFARPRRLEIAAAINRFRPQVESGRALPATLRISGTGAGGPAASGR